MQQARFHQATFAHAETPVLFDLTWTLNEGEHWIVSGDTGSGKTSLLEALAGRLRLLGGTRELPERTTLLSFREAKPRVQYYQQRFDFADSEEPFTLADFLAGAPPLFGLDARRAQSFITLSNGQMRKARLAKALAAKPRLLLLDDPFQGLDPESRGELAAILDALDTTCVVTCRAEDLPGAKILRLAKGRIIDTPGAMPTALRGHENHALEHAHAKPWAWHPETIIELHNVTVRHSGSTILDSIAWTVRAGERWALLGPNGAGKTTLLSLLVGDHPQAFSNSVKLFGSQRGSGETLWDIRRRVGFVSPEFHLAFAEDLTALEAAETGYTDTLLHTPATPEQTLAVKTIFEELGHAEWMHAKMRRLSTGQQRIALLVRALVKKPPLVILDEPYQMLDASQVRRLNAWLDANLRPDQTLIVVTHRREELPAMVTQTLRLERGRIVV